MSRERYRSERYNSSPRRKKRKHKKKKHKKKKPKKCRPYKPCDPCKPCCTSSSSCSSSSSSSCSSSSEKCCPIVVCKGDKGDKGKKGCKGDPGSPGEDFEGPQYMLQSDYEISDSRHFDTTTGNIPLLTLEYEGAVNQELASLTLSLYGTIDNKKIERCDLNGPLMITVRVFDKNGPAIVGIQTHELTFRAVDNLCNFDCEAEILWYFSYNFPFVIGAVSGGEITISLETNVGNFDVGLIDIPSISLFENNFLALNVLTQLPL